MLRACALASLLALAACAPSAGHVPSTPTPSAHGIDVAPAPLAGPVSSSAVALSPGGALVAAVNPDSASVSLVDASTLAVLAEVSVGADPRTLVFTPDGSHLLVACHGAGAVSVVDVASLREVTRWPVGYLPYGIVATSTLAYVSLLGEGRVVAVDLPTGTLAHAAEAGRAPAGLALTGDGASLLVSGLYDGSVRVLDGARLAHRAFINGDVGANLSQNIALSPDGARAYLPLTRFNAASTDLQFDTTVFPVVSVVDTAAWALLPAERITVDTADRPVSAPFAAAVSPDGARAYVAHAGSDDLSVLDLATGRAIAHLALGANPRGLALSREGDRLFVDNVLDGTLTVVDTQALQVEQVVALTRIPLDPVLLEGKRLFNAAREPDLTTDNWVSCASCHFDGGHDARTWAGFPDGPRNTPALFGAAQTLPLHWSGDLDELADVELTVRDIQGGAGLVPGPASDSLGPRHAGRSAALDALVAYMGSLAPLAAPPGRDAAAEARGAQVFEAQGCAACHPAPLYTDRQQHDVGTGDPAVERNSHGRGTAFDTPSLRGLWASAPYLHDGSAATLTDALDRGQEHAVASLLTDADLDDLLAFLRGL
jgi:YVTN family beta-propeller protein